CCFRSVIMSTAPSSLSPLSLHDALPIYCGRLECRDVGGRGRRSSAGRRRRRHGRDGRTRGRQGARHAGGRPPQTHTTECHGHHRDRKSTRLNSSHVKISYAVFCLKKKRK